MASVCTQCKKSFEVTERELRFLAEKSPVFGGKQFLIPPPDSCPECRQRQLLGWRNERSIYERTSNCCAKTIVSMYRPETPYRVFCHDCYWSDKWDPQQAGRPFDFSRPFFEQFNDLLRDSPLIALINTYTENSPHCHRIHDGKNNYMAHIALDGPEDLLYTHYTMASKQSVDITYSHRCEKCYELVDAENCKQCFYSNRIRNCRECFFCEDCIGCANCFGCKNLVGREYCIYNEQCSKDEFIEYLKRAHLDSYAAVQEHQRQTRRFFLTLPYQHLISRNCVNVTGTNVFDCINCYETYDFRESEQLALCTYGEYCADCVGCYGIGHSVGCYNSVSLLHTSDNFFTATGVHSANLIYCYECYAHSANLFGCCGLKESRYCILNKQYTQAEYQELVPKIIEHMKETGEWGRFFPLDISPFAYNETVAMIYFPIDREFALRASLAWYDPPHEGVLSERAINADEIADSIKDIPDEIVDWTLLSSEGRQPFRIMPQELAFYREFSIPIPRLHYNERHRRRKMLRNTRKLWPRCCDRCERRIESNYHPERPEIVYCEECYNEAAIESAVVENPLGAAVSNF